MVAHRLLMPVIALAALSGAIVVALRVLPPLMPSLAGVIAYLLIGLAIAWLIALRRVFEEAWRLLKRVLPNAEPPPGPPVRNAPRSARSRLITGLWFVLQIGLIGGTLYAYADIAERDGAPMQDSTFPFANRIAPKLFFNAQIPLRLSLT